MREPDSAAGKYNRNRAKSGSPAVSCGKATKQTLVQLYLPIADIPVNVFLILAMGAAVGFVSGMFGIGGGFLMTPLLIFVGIAPAVAVASVASAFRATAGAACGSVEASRTSPRDDGCTRITSMPRSGPPAARGSR